MKINQGFELREMCGEHIVIGTGVENIDFSKVISLNESAAWLWRAVEGQEFTPASMAALLMEEYDVDAADEIIRQLSEFRYTQEVKKVFMEMSAAVKNLDADGVAGCVETMRGYLEV